MSVEAAKTFSKLMTNEDLLNRVNEAETVEERVQIAQEEGCEFSREDFEAATAELMAAKSPADVFTGEIAEVVGHAAIQMLGVRQSVMPPYGDPWFYSRIGKYNPPSQFNLRTGR
jgi:predicted ribosomally synthesized peptide with nif11-like leader